MAFRALLGGGQGEQFGAERLNLTLDCRGIQGIVFPFQLRLLAGPDRTFVGQDPLVWVDGRSYFLLIFALVRIFWSFCWGPK